MSHVEKKSERLKHQKEHKHQKISAMNRINDLISPNKARIYRFNEGTLNDSSMCSNINDESFTIYHT